MATNTGSNFLSNLPSRGLFSSTVSSSNLGGMRIYVCDHNTSPPVGISPLVSYSIFVSMANWYKVGFTKQMTEILA